MENTQQDMNKKTYSTKPFTKWSLAEVVDWARNVLLAAKCDPQPIETTVKILHDQLFIGKALSLVPSVDCLVTTFQVPEDTATILWTEIQKLKKAPIKTMSYEEIMESSIASHHPLHRDWALTRNDNELYRKMNQWLKKNFIAKTEDGSLTNHSSNAQDQSTLVHEEVSQVLQQETLSSRQRDKVSDQIDLFVDLRMTRYKEYDKIFHVVFLLTGDKRIGKTRTARELERRARTRVPNKCKFRTAWIDFMNGQKLCSHDRLTRSPSVILGIRLLCTLLLRLSTEEFYGKIEKLPAAEWHNSLLIFFDIKTVMNLVKMHFEDEQSMVLIVMDDIDALKTLGHDTFQYMLGSLSTFISNSDRATVADAIRLNQIILPVICGTSADVVEDAVRFCGFGRVEPSLQLLPKESIEFV